MSQFIRAYNVKSSDFGTSSSDYGDLMTIDFTDKMPTEFKVRSLRILSIHFPLITYNIINRAGFQNTDLIIDVGGNIQTISLDPGFYTRDTLLNGIMLKITNAYAIPGYTCFISWNQSTFLTTITIQDALGVPQVFEMSDITIKPVGEPVSIPSILELMGFNITVPHAGSSSYTSEGPLNVFKDRVCYITSDEVQGENTSIDSLGQESWHKGICSVIPFGDKNAGDIIEYIPGNNAPIIKLTCDKNNRSFSFHLARERYPVFGPTIIDWTMIVEFR
jgi:hypothetical protein